MINNDSLHWRQMKNGDPRALEYLFKRHYQQLYEYGMRFCRKDELVKDCIQDLFANVWLNRMQLSDVKSVTAYLLVSLRRAMLAKIQREKHFFFDFTTHPQLLEVIPSPEEKMILRETEASRQRRIRRVITELPERIREALYLKTYCGLSYREISTVMDISYQVARNYIAEAFRRIREKESELIHW